MLSRCSNLTVINTSISHQSQCINLNDGGPNRTQYKFWRPSRHSVVGRGGSGWCSDVTSTHGAWRHAGVRFLFPGVLLIVKCRRVFHERSVLCVSTLRKATYCSNDPGRTRTCNPRLRGPMPYPLGHGARCPQLNNCCHRFLKIIYRIMLEQVRL